MVLADEAHTLDLGVGRTLLNAAQEVGTERPCLLVLAGTPNLEGRLNAMGASFWDRAEILRIGRLDDEATREALRRPFASEGVTVEDAALKLMAREAQNYPYFVQLLGNAVWQIPEPESSGPRHRAVHSGVRLARLSSDPGPLLPSQTRGTDRAGPAPGGGRG